MPAASEDDRALEAARQSGLIVVGEPMLVLLSGGRDSVCLLDVAVRLGARVRALHVNYGLRDGAAQDEELCQALCERLGVPLHLERAELESSSPHGGNLQALARDVRYGHAEALVRQIGSDYATAHTASDQAETVLYRLAVSPGRRALLGMEPRRGRLVRPLLGATRAETGRYCEGHGLRWREDPSNADRRFARARVRHDVLAALRSLNPHAELTIAETARLLRDEAEVLERYADGALARLGGAAAGAVALTELHEEPPALARLVLRRLASAAAERELSLSREQAEAIMALGGRGGSQALDLGGGLRALVEYGTLRFSTAQDAGPPEPVALTIPGRVRFGDWEVEALIDVPGEVTVSAEALGPVATVRSWRDGDRMRPAGLEGTKSLQNLFTDAKVPRELRRTLPVVEIRGEVAWIAGVALDQRFAASGGGPGTVGLWARKVSS